jgi:CheY-like chemotaxis protein
MEEPDTILLVDDQAVILEVGTAHLERAGYRVEIALDGPTALACLRRQRVDLVLLDIVMPEMGGLQVLAALRDDPRTSQLPVIMATARQESVDMVRAFDLGATDYVTKPLDWAVVIARIAAHLRTRDSDSAESPTGHPWNFSSGSMIDGRYRLEAPLGRGAHGAVWRALDCDLNSLVAVKLLANGSSTNPDAHERFRREGLALCRIRHPHAVDVKDIRTDSSGVPFLVMELLEGHTLEEELRRHRRLPSQRTAEILEPICAALTTAHQKGVLHRDVKPSNIFLHREKGREKVKILDFGVARFVGGHNLERRLSNAEVPPGTPAYMAPERFSKGHYDGSVDCYSLGIMLYEMLTGDLPFSVDDGNILRLIRLHATQIPKPLRDLRPELSTLLESIVLSALHKDPRKRPSVLQLGQRFKRALQTP